MGLQDPAWKCGGLDGEGVWSASVGAKGQNGGSLKARLEGLSPPVWVLLPSQCPCVRVCSESGVTPGLPRQPSLCPLNLSGALPPVFLFPPLLDSPAEGAPSVPLQAPAETRPIYPDLPLAPQPQKLCPPQSQGIWAHVPCTPGPALCASTLGTGPLPGSPSSPPAQTQLSLRACHSHCPWSGHACPWGWIGRLGCPAMPGRPMALWAAVSPLTWLALECSQSVQGRWPGVGGGAAGAGTPGAASVPPPPPPQGRASTTGALVQTGRKAPTCPRLWLHGWGDLWGRIQTF